MSESEPKSLGKKFTPTSTPSSPPPEKPETTTTSLNESKVVNQEEQTQASPIFGKTTPLFAKKTPLAIVRESAVASSQAKPLLVAPIPQTSATSAPSPQLPVLPPLPQEPAVLTPPLPTMSSASAPVTLHAPTSALTSASSLTPKLEDALKKPSPPKLPEIKQGKMPAGLSEPLAVNPDLENQVFIPAGTEIEGSIKTDRPLIIHGRVGGTGKSLGFIQNNALVYIGKTANVEANIQCEKLEVYGRADGEIIARKEVLLHKDGKLLGKIQTPNFHTEQGSFFKGTMEMTGEDVPSGTPR
jgi:cytoskeletal protein CcmA (bactofilin family)